MTVAPSASRKPSFLTRAHGAKSHALLKVSLMKIDLSSLVVQNLSRSLQGPHACVAVKVIDPRGNEVMSVHTLGAQRY